MAWINRNHARLPLGLTPTMTPPEVVMPDLSISIEAAAECFQISNTSASGLAGMSSKRKPLDAYSGHSEFRRVKSPFVNLKSEERFRNIILGAFGFIISSMGLVASFMRMTNVSRSSASGSYLGGSVVGFLIMTVILGALWFSSLSLVFRSQKLRGYGGMDVSGDLLMFALVVLSIGLLVGVLSGIAVALGDATNPSASRAIPITLFALSLVPTMSSGLYLRYRFHRMRSRSTARAEPHDNESADE